MYFSSESLWVFQNGNRALIHYEAIKTFECKIHTVGIKYGETNHEGIQYHLLDPSYNLTNVAELPRNCVLTLQAGDSMWNCVTLHQPAVSTVSFTHSTLATARPPVCLPFRIPLPPPSLHCSK